MASFADWKLSSSESEDDSVTKGVLLTIKNSKKTKEPSLNTSDTYVPLSERLKARDIGLEESSGEELPEINFVSSSGEVGKGKMTSGGRYKNVSQKSSDSETKCSITRRKIEEENDCAIKSLKPQMNASCETSGRLKPERRRANAVNKLQAEKRKAMNSQLKALKPEECMKHMECRISRGLASMLVDVDVMKDLQDEFHPHCVLEESTFPSVHWRRANIPTETNTPEFNTEPEMLVILPADNFMKMASAHRQINSRETGLIAWMKKLQVDNIASEIHLVCHGLQAYGKSKHSRKKKSHVPELTAEGVEGVLVDLQVECGTTVSYTENAEEIVNMIKQITKSIGEAPYKRLKRQDVQFINEIPSIKIDTKTGNGLKKAWKQMLQQFHNVTAVMASAIADKYPSLLSLVQAYEGCGSDLGRAERLLADIPVRRGVGTLQTNRRIGPELSFKIQKLLMSMNPDDRLY